MIHHLWTNEMSYLYSKTQSAIVTVLFLLQGNRKSVREILETVHKF